MREKVNYMYNIMTEQEGDYLYLEVGMPVLKEGSDVSTADQVWEWLGIGVIGPPPASDQERILTDKALTTSNQDWILMDETPPTSDQDQTLTDEVPPTLDQDRTLMNGQPVASE